MNPENDNQTSSHDSRDWGLIQSKTIKNPFVHYYEQGITLIPKYKSGAKWATPEDRKNSCYPTVADLLNDTTQTVYHFMPSDYNLLIVYIKDISNIGKFAEYCPGIQIEHFCLTPNNGIQMYFFCERKYAKFMDQRFPFEIINHGSTVTAAGSTNNGAYVLYGGVTDLPNIAAYPQLLTLLKSPKKKHSNIKILFFKDESER